MNLVARMFRPAAPSAEVRGFDTLRDAYAFGGGETDSGVRVTVPGSLYLDSVFAAVTLLAEAVGTLPLKVYQRSRGGGRVEAWFEDVYGLLHDEPNAEMPAVVVWSLVELHLVTWGNSYLGKQLEGGRVVGLWPLLPDRMRVARENGRKVFRYLDPQGREHEYGQQDVLHVMGPSLDGLTGMSPIGYARHTIGAGLAGEQFAGRFFKNSATPRGVLQVDGELDDEAVERIAGQWQAAVGGANMHKVAILEGGAKFQPVTMPLEDAQFVEQAKLSVQKVARIFRVPPEMIGGDSGGSMTYSNVESQSLAFLTRSVRPWLVRIEQALARDRQLFPGAGRALYPEFLAEAMLRADVQTRGEWYTRALDPVTGWMRRDEVRSLENLPPEVTPGSGRVVAAAGGDAGAGAADEERERMELAALKALAAQRMALAIRGGVLSQEEAREPLGVTGEPPPMPDSSGAGGDGAGGEDSAAGALDLEHAFAGLVNGTAHTNGRSPG